MIYDIRHDSSPLNMKYIVQVSIYDIFFVTYIYMLINLD